MKPDANFAAFSFFLLQNEVDNLVNYVQAQVWWENGSNDKENQDKNSFLPMAMGAPGSKEKAVCCVSKLTNHFD